MLFHLVSFLNALRSDRYVDAQVASPQNRCSRTGPVSAASGSQTTMQKTAGSATIRSCTIRTSRATPAFLRDMSSCSASGGGGRIGQRRLERTTSCDSALLRSQLHACWAPTGHHDRVSGHAGRKGGKTAAAVHARAVGLPHRQSRALMSRAHNTVSRQRRRHIAALQMVLPGAGGGSRWRRAAPGGHHRHLCSVWPAPAARRDADRAAQHSRPGLRAGCDPGRHAAARAGRAAPAAAAARDGAGTCGEPAAYVPSSVDCGRPHAETPRCTS